MATFKIGHSAAASKRTVVRMSEPGKVYVEETTRLLGAKSHSHIVAVALRVYQVARTHIADGSLLCEYSAAKLGSSLLRVPTPEEEDHSKAETPEAGMVTAIDLQLSIEDLTLVDSIVEEFRTSRSRVIRAALVFCGHVARSVYADRKVFSRSKEGADTILFDQAALRHTAKELEDKQVPISHNKVNRVETFESGDRTDYFDIFLNMRDNCKRASVTKEHQEVVTRIISEFRRVALELQPSIKPAEDDENEIRLSGDEIVLALCSPVCLLSNKIVHVDRISRAISLDLIGYERFRDEATGWLKALIESSEPSFAEEYGVAQPT